MVNRSLVTEEVLVPPQPDRILERPIIFGVVGTQDGDSSHAVKQPRMTKTNDDTYGDLDGSSTIPLVLAAFNQYGIADVIVVPTVAGELEDGWEILAQDGRATHMAGDDVDWAVDNNSALDLGNASSLVAAKLAAAERLQGIVAVNAPNIGVWDSTNSAVLPVTTPNVIAWGARNAGDRLLGVHVGGAVVPTFRASGNWTMNGAAAQVMGAVADNPFYLHPEYLPVRGIAETATNLKFAPRDATADSELLKFANIMAVIRTTGFYYTWGKSLMQNPGNDDARKYVEVRGVADHFEHFIDQLYLQNIRAPDRTELNRLICDGYDIEVERLVNLRAIVSGTCTVDESVTGNQVAYDLEFTKEHPIDSVKVRKIINIR